MEDRLFHELKSLEPAESELDVRARFRTFLSEGVNRIRIRKPDYFLPLNNAFTGPDARSDARVHAWDRYRALLTQGFEDQPLFGEDEAHGITFRASLSATSDMVG